MAKSSCAAARIGAAIACAAFAPRVLAQCPDWSAGLFTAAGIDGEVVGQFTFDDGSGPALYVSTTAAYDGVGVVGLSRWNGTSFQPVAGSAGIGINCVAVHDDGTGPQVYAGGVFAVTPSLVRGVARWDGTAWSVVGATNGDVRALAEFDADGLGPMPARLFAGGNFTTIGGTAASSIARLDGTTWSPLSTGLGVTSGISSCLALSTYDPDGAGPLPERLYAGGNFTTAGGVSAANFAAWNGSAWSGIGAGVSAAVETMTVFDADDLGPLFPVLYLGGAFTSAGGFTSRACATYDGTILGNAGIPVTGAKVKSLLVHDYDGAGPGLPSLFAGGEFVGSGLRNIARRNGVSWVSAGTGVNREVRSLASFDEGSGARLFAGGRFVEAGGVPAHHIARFDGAAWSALRPGKAPSDPVLALSTYDDGHGRALYVGGGFVNVGTLAAAGIARWDGTSWSALGAGLNDGPSALQVFDDGTGPALYAGGSFTTAGGATAIHVARWNGTSWSAVGGGLGTAGVGFVTAFAVFDDGSGPRLYAGGSFPGNLARWDGSTWSTVGGGLNGSVTALAVHDEGDGPGPALFVSGQFFTAGGMPASRIARWRGGAWSTLGSGLQSSAFALASFDPGDGAVLVAGGPFQSAGGNGPGVIMKWSSGAWSPMFTTIEGGPGSSPHFRSLCVHDDGTGRGAALYGVGDFVAIDGVISAGVVRWDGATWESLDGGIFGLTYVLGSFDDGIDAGAALFAGGSFFTAGPNAAFNLARWSNCGATGTVVCAGDGSGTACPCGNESAPASGAGCQNSLGTGAVLSASGFASLGSDDLVLAGNQMPDAAALYFQGTLIAGGASGTAFGDGLRCAGGTVVRLGTQTNASGASLYPGAGDASISSMGAVTAPGVRVYQIWYRNAATYCTSATFNLSNGLRIDWRP